MSCSFMSWSSHSPQKGPQSFWGTSSVLSHFPDGALSFPGQHPYTPHPQSRVFRLADSRPREASSHTPHWAGTGVGGGAVAGGWPRAGHAGVRRELCARGHLSCGTFMSFSIGAEGRPKPGLSLSLSLSLSLPPSLEGGRQGVAPRGEEELRQSRLGFCPTGLNPHKLPTHSFLKEPAVANCVAACRALCPSCYYCCHHQ